MKRFEIIVLKFAFREGKSIALCLLVSTDMIGKLNGGNDISVSDIACWAVGLFIEGFVQGVDHVSRTLFQDSRLLHRNRLC